MKVVVAVWLRLPLDPVTVMTELPLGVVGDVVMVIVDVDVAGLGLKEPLHPEANPLTPKETAPLNPPVRVMVTV